MMKQALDFIREQGLNVYEIALLTEDGVESAYCQPCNPCNAAFSVTKLFVVTMVGILADHGLLRPEDRLLPYLQEDIAEPYAEIWDEVTIHQALTHCMGLDYGVLDIDRDCAARYPTDDYLAYILRYPPKFTPGTHRKYTDVPHYLLSRVITSLTGKPADVVIEEEILRPLSFGPCAWARCPKGYTIGSSGLYARAADLVKLAGLYLGDGMHRGQRIVSKDWVRLAERERYDLYPCRGTGFVGKGGMNGQMVMYHRVKSLAVAWLAHEPTGRDSPLPAFLENL